MWYYRDKDAGGREGRGGSVDKKMPVLFIGHGSPMNIVMDNSYTRALAALGKGLPRPKAIMVVSAHWLTRGTAVTCTDRPRTIHDFYGFPEELYALEYPCPGAPDLASAVVGTVKSVPILCDTRWGLDHASWAVLRHIYPAADIPVLEMGLDYRFGERDPKPLHYHYDLARELAPLRRQGVLIIGSGNIVHNLRIIDFDTDAKPYEWALEFDGQVKDCLVKRRHSDLMEYTRMGKAATLSVPSLDHYLPMIYAIGLQEQDDKLTFVHEGMQNASVSMRCFRIG
jgi:4,5-DOPA dioxygenase extradiol